MVHSQGCRASSASLDQLLDGRCETLKFGDVVTAREFEEALTAETLLDIDGNELLEFCWQFFKANGRNQLPCKTLVLIGASAKKYVITLFSSNFDSHQADVADVVLSAGVMASRNV